MITGFSHVSIVVPDIEAAARMLAERYGLSVGERMVNEQQGVRLAYVELANGKIELMEPSRPDSPIAKFLERNPKGGIHHFSLNVDDMEQTARTLGASGVRILGDGNPQYNVAGERIAFVHPPIFSARSSNSNSTNPNEAKQYRHRRGRRRPHRDAAGAACRQAPVGRLPCDLGPRPGARQGCWPSRPAPIVTPAATKRSSPIRTSPR